MYELLRCLPHGDHWFSIDAREIRVDPDARIAVDVDAFWAALAVGDFEEAVRLHGGEFLEQCSEEWVQSTRERTARAYTSALMHCANDRAGRGDLDGALAFAHRVLSVDPWREDAVRCIVSLYNRMGDRAAALDFFHRFAERLHEEFGVRPSAASVDLYESIKDSTSGERSRQLPLFEEHPASGDWVGSFPWWWVARLRDAPTCLVLAAYLRTLELSRHGAFDVPADTPERLGMGPRVLERSLRELCARGVLREVSAAKGSLPRFAFVYETPRGERIDRPRVMAR